MKILLVMDPGIHVPPKGYGGIERVIEILAKQYMRLGHEVHLLVTTGSHVEGCTMHNFGKEGFPPKKINAYKAILVAWAFLWKHRNEFDLIHSFGRLLYLLPILNHPVKKIMSYQREISSRNIRLINSLQSKNLVFTACSANLLTRVKAAGDWEVVYNAVEFKRYTLNEHVAENAPLIFLGRIEKIKGCHTAIRIAKATGNKLIIAGNISTLPEEKAYFENEIKPHIDDIQVRYVGTVTDAQKNDWLGKAKALIFPIEWNEPFGIVMAEAMACGTPVIAFKRGSVDEVIDEGITGFKADTEEQMIKYVSKVHHISRADCRNHALQRFDAGIIAKCYLDIVDEGRKKIVIISTHQPAANPRALKEYETLKKEGYSVKHLYTYNANWSYRIDEEKFTRGTLRRQDFIEVGGNPHNRPFRYFMSRAVRRLFSLFAPVIPFCKEMAIAKGTFEIWRVSSKYPADLYIAHYLGALPGAVRVSRKHKASLIFDAEDFHRGEQSYYASQIGDVIAVEDKFLPAVNFITTASPLITEEYKRNYPRINVLTVNNVFSKKFLQPISRGRDEKLKLFWFSQHIGLHRGLEIFIQALNYLSDADISLTIMGNKWSEAYQENLLALSNGPRQVFFKESSAPEDLFSIASQYDIGLAGEIPNCLNKELCLSNKIFTYLLAGNCVLASDMQGQKDFMDQHRGIGFSYKHNDAKDLANKIKMLYNDRALLQRCKEESISVAAQELNWESESRKWLQMVNQLLQKADGLPVKNGRGGDVIKIKMTGYEHI